MQTMTGYLFDFNGTLFVDSDKHEKAWRALAREQFNRDISDQEFQERIHGWNTEFIMKYLTSDDSLSKEAIDEMGRQKEALYREFCLEDRDRFHLAEGAEEFLDQRVSDDSPRTIATASRKDNVDFYIEHFHLERWFEPSKIIYDNGTLLGKPDPDIYLRAAAAIGLPIGNCVVFEDAPSGIESAHRAGAAKIIVLAPQGQGESLKNRPGVDRVIRDFRELL